MIRSDKSVILAIKQNDNAVLNELYCRYRDSFIHQFSTCNPISIEDAKDIYQEVMIVFTQQIQNGKLNEIKVSLKAYIFGIGRQLLRNKLKEEFNRRKRQGAYSLTTLKHDETYSVGARAQIVVNELNKMRDPCRSILKLYYQEGLSLEEIALSLQYKSSKSVKVQKYRCLKALKEMIFKQKADWFNEL